MSKEEVFAVKKELDKVFYSPEFLMGSFPRFWDRIKGGKVSQRVARAYYENQAIVQVFKPVKKPSTRLKIQTTSPFKVLFMDTMIIDDFYIVNTIDLFSKFADSTVFKKPVGGADAVKALQGFLKASGGSLEQVGEIRCDGGSEFSGDFAKYVGEKRIVALPYAKSEMSPVERFNGTLRRILEKLKLLSGKTVSYIYRYVPKALKAYNDAVHSSTGFTPSEALKSLYVQKEIVKGLRSVVEDRDDKLVAGTSVRLSARDAQNAFDTKIRPNWSMEVYKVKSVKGSRVELDNGDVVKEHQVRVIDPDLLMNVNRVRVEQERTARAPPSQKKALGEIKDYLQAPQVEKLGDKRSRRKPKKLEEGV